MTHINELVEQWLAVDVNPQTIKEITDLQTSNNTAELERRLRHRIAFGTAGLRARMEAGFARMNDVTVLQASQGLASYVLQQGGSSVVIGHDHRHHSKEFAMITASCFLMKGFKVYLLHSSTDLVATPLVPFAVDLYGASCGVMITASHNPAMDNGYKVYWSNGCQIIPPHDHAIANEIMNNLEPMDGVWDTESVMNENKDMLHLVKDEVVDAYLHHLQSLVKTQVDKRFVYTPMHGVGYELFSKAVQLIGITDVVVVDQQVEPDADFPTVKFPNPEEKGALALAMSIADNHGIDVVLANDPDADRFSCAVKVGQWRQLTGNEIGFLFADYIIKTHKNLDNVYLLNSTVSSQMISSMASVEGFHYTDTLTGFKWIGNKAIELEADGYTVPFAYEEAIGFMFQGIHDKDGISSSLVFLQMVDQWAKDGTNAIEVLEQGFKRYGYFKEYNSYYTVTNPELTKHIFDTIRSGDHDKIGTYKVTYWRDLTTGYDSSTTNNIPALPTDPSSQMLTVKLSTGSEEIRFTARGSGTEPKLKVYIEARAASEERAKELAFSVWETLKHEWFSSEGLVEA